MNEITIEKVYCLLEKLTQYVMNEVFTRRDTASRDDIQKLREELLSKRYFYQAMDELRFRKAKDSSSKST